MNQASAKVPKPESYAMNAFFSCLMYTSCSVSMVLTNKAKRTILIL